MGKPLTNREFEMFHLLVNLEQELNDCNPEVGIGPNRETLARRVAGFLSFDIDEDDIIEIGESISGQ